MANLTNRQTELADRAGETYRGAKVATVEAARRYLDAAKLVAEARDSCRGRRGAWKAWLERARIPARTGSRLVAIANSGMDAEGLAAVGVRGAAASVGKSATVADLVEQKPTHDLLIMAHDLVGEAVAVFAEIYANPEVPMALKIEALPHLRSIACESAIAVQSAERIIVKADKAEREKHGVDEEGTERIQDWMYESTIAMVESTREAIRVLKPHVPENYGWFDEAAGAVPAAMNDEVAR